MIFSPNPDVWHRRNRLSIHEGPFCEKRYFGPEGKQKLSKVKLRRDPKTKKKVFERTWEVIKDTTGQYSYNIRANPEYGAHLK